MIRHLSIGAHGPNQAAGILAELMGGVAVPFPPNPGSFFGLSSTSTDRMSKFIRREPSGGRAAITAGAL
jgi:hypothetical protein